MAEQRWTRTELIRAGLLAPPVIAASVGASPVLAATPACGDDDDLTLEQTAGPFYKPRSPERRSLRADERGTPLTITGRVLRRNCVPVRNALLDFWQADARGEYDNAGFRLRGHQRTDLKGRYRLETVVPGLYPGRARHIHVLVAARAGNPLVTQLYFTGEAGNARDGIFDRALLLEGLRRRPGGWTARFDFVVA